MELAMTISRSIAVLFAMLLSACASEDGRRNRAAEYVQATPAHRPLPHLGFVSLPLFALDGQWPGRFLAYGIWREPWLQWDPQGVFSVYPNGSFGWPSGIGFWNLHNGTLFGAENGYGYGWPSYGRPSYGYAPYFQRPRQAWPAPGTVPGDPASDATPVAERQREPRMRLPGNTSRDNNFWGNRHPGSLFEQDFGGAAARASAEFDSDAGRPIEQRVHQGSEMDN
jgi:hypothetical protein